MIDLNADLGESFGIYQLGNDELLIPFITSANVACGFHAGDSNVMYHTVKLCKENRVRVGAHPGYMDLQGFGRRKIQLTIDEMVNSVLYQVGALKGICTFLSVPLTHVKPHGALYTDLARDFKASKALAIALHKLDPNIILYGLSGSEMQVAAERIGIQFYAEVFSDRGYDSSGHLVKRSLEGAFVTSVDEAVNRMIHLIKTGTIESVDGQIITLKADTVCLHGDGVHALELAKRLNNALIEKNI